VGLFDPNRSPPVGHYFMIWGLPVLDPNEVVHRVKRFKVSPDSQCLLQGTCPWQRALDVYSSWKPSEYPSFHPCFLVLSPSCPGEDGSSLLWSTDDLATGQMRTLRLFASISHSDKLEEVVINVPSVFGFVNDCPTSVDELGNLSSLSVYVEMMPLLLIGVIQRKLDAPDAEATWNTSHVNSVWVLRTCMLALAESKNGSWRHLDECTDDSLRITPLKLSLASRERTSSMGI